jgi:hypothetical protein
MAHQQVIDIRHIIRRIDAGSLVCSIAKWNRDSVLAEYRIDQYPTTFKLNVLGRMPKPDGQVPMDIEGLQIGLLRWKPEIGS